MESSCSVFSPVSHLIYFGALPHPLALQLLRALGGSEGTSVGARLRRAFCIGAYLSGGGGVAALLPFYFVSLLLNTFPSPPPPFFVFVLLVLSLRAPALAGFFEVAKLMP